MTCHSEGMTLEAALERIAQLEAALMTVNAFATTAPARAAIAFQGEEVRLGIAGTRAGVDLRNLVVDELLKEQDLARDRMLIIIRGHIPRQA